MCPKNKIVQNVLNLKNPKKSTLFQNQQNVAHILIFVLQNCKNLAQNFDLMFRKISRNLREILRKTKLKFLRQFLQQPQLSPSNMREDKQQNNLFYGLPPSQAADNSHIPHLLHANADINQCASVFVLSESRFFNFSWGLKT